MELWQLENAVRKQCLWNYDTNRRLQTNSKFEGKAELGQILFIGIAELYGFDQHEILEYIDLDPIIYKKRLQEFKKAQKEMQKRIALDLAPHKDFIYKVYVKTALVQNYIKYHHNNTGYLSYKDLLKG